MAAISFFLMFSVGLFAGTLSQFLISRWLKAILVAFAQNPSERGAARNRSNVAGMLLAAATSPSGWVLCVGIWLGVTHRFGYHSGIEWMWFFLGFSFGHAGLFILLHHYVKRLRRARAQESPPSQP
jgi:hypothetical protein